MVSWTKYGGDVGDGQNGAHLKAGERGWLEIGAGWMRDKGDERTVRRIKTNSIIIKLLSRVVGGSWVTLCERLPAAWASDGCPAVFEMCH